MSHSARACWVSWARVRDTSRSESFGAWRGVGSSSSSSSGSPIGIESYEAGVRFRRMLDRSRPRVQTRPDK